MAAGVRIGLQEVQESERVRERVCVCVSVFPAGQQKGEEEKTRGPKEEGGGGDER